MGGPRFLGGFLLIPLSSGGGSGAGGGRAAGCWFAVWSGGGSVSIDTASPGYSSGSGVALSFAVAGAASYTGS